MVPGRRYSRGVSDLTDDEMAFLHGAFDRARDGDTSRLAEFYAFIWGVLTTLREEAVAPSEIHLWPEHFDVAFDDREVTYGGSPGDENHEEPYLYVGPWTKPEPAPEWNAVGFNGAEAPWTDEAAALAFFRDRRDALHG